MSLICLKKLQYTLRNNEMEFPTVKTVHFGKHSIQDTGPFIWSKLSSDFRTSTSLNSFKHNIRKVDLSGFTSN